MLGSQVGPPYGPRGRRKNGKTPAGGSARREEANRCLSQSHHVPVRSGFFPARSWRGFNEASRVSAAPQMLTLPSPAHAETGKVPVKLQMLSSSGRADDEMETDSDSERPPAPLFPQMRPRFDLGAGG